MTYFRPNIDSMTAYVPGEQPVAAATEKFIKLNTNENPYPCSPKVKVAIGRVVQQGLQKYPDPDATAFRIRAGEVLGVDPDCILCGNGSDDILTIITRTFVDSGDRLRYATPGYILYKTLAEIQGAEQETVPFNKDWTLGDTFCTAGDRLKLAFLANPNSPSGTMLPPERVDKFVGDLPCPLVVDEAYVDFADTNCLALLQEYGNALITRSLSKSYALAGLRFGFVVAAPAMIEQLRKVKDSYNCDALSIAGATAAIDDQAWLAETRAKIIATRQRLTAALRELGFDCPDSQANFVWAPHPNGPVEPLYQQLKAGGVLVRYMNFPQWGDGLRISVGTDPQVDACLELLRAAM